VARCFLYADIGVGLNPLASARGIQGRTGMFDQPKTQGNEHEAPD
jgi:hypothetical protein